MLLLFGILVIFRKSQSTSSGKFFTLERYLNQQNWNKSLYLTGMLHIAWFVVHVFLFLIHIFTFINCTLLGGTLPLVGTMAKGLSPEYFSLNSPALDPWFVNAISFDIVLLLATRLPKSTTSSISSIGCIGYLWLNK